MKIFAKISAALAAGIALCALSAPANALVITYSQIVTGAIPGSPAPYLTVTITNTTGGVNITLEPQVSGSEFVTAVFFSTNDTSFVISNISSDPDLDPANCNGSAPAGTGPWQMCMAFDPADHASFPDSVTVFVSGITEANFITNSDGWLSVAHIQGIEPDCSGWVGSYTGPGGIPPSNDGPCGGTSVPEPGTLGLLGLGLAALGMGFGRRKQV